LLDAALKKHLSHSVDVHARQRRNLATADFVIKMQDHVTQIEEYKLSHMDDGMPSVALSVVEESVQVLH
jgi:hypothetical protein